MKSTINEEDELKLAVEKLTEIRDRTQIKILKIESQLISISCRLLLIVLIKDLIKKQQKMLKKAVKSSVNMGINRGSKCVRFFTMQL